MGLLGIFEIFISRNDIHYSEHQDRKKLLSKIDGIKLTLRMSGQLKLQYNTMCCSSSFINAI